MKPRLQPQTVQAISRVFDELDYRLLGEVYCHEGGEEFWRARRGRCRRLGIKLGEVLKLRLKPGGRSLYVGAGVAELPVLIMETVDLQRAVVACNLRGDEVQELNRAAKDLPFRFEHRDATSVRGSFDHLWIVSVLNDPESYPELSELSYGRANPVTFNLTAFRKERRAVTRLVDRCLKNLTRRGLVTTSTEEAIWIAEWCAERQIHWKVERRTYKTALVEDPICFIQIGTQ
ncbi:hypothetical protein DNFV4_00459 [Nitrospira tepida]|uniref:Uncharacterized protein n=1 Tax=Nitrospira tepida TaxID=2973512 RepID=A0AA86T1H1_9BACT|nr:hypothetical protein [Nitrospira tepida]CAI4030035.1 hypothetical protein DNFV4_00459 [Nitrospira tepida]